MTKPPEHGAPTTGRRASFVHESRSNEQNVNFITFYRHTSTGCGTKGNAGPTDWEGAYFAAGTLAGRGLNHMAATRVSR